MTATRNKRNKSYRVKAKVVKRSIRRRLRRRKIKIGSKGKKKF